MPRIQATWSAAAARASPVIGVGLRTTSYPRARATAAAPSSARLADPTTRVVTRARSAWRLGVSLDAPGGARFKVADDRSRIRRATAEPVEYIERVAKRRRVRHGRPRPDHARVVANHVGQQPGIERRAAGLCKSAALDCRQMLPHAVERGDVGALGKQPRNHGLLCPQTPRHRPPAPSATRRRPTPGRQAVRLARSWLAKRERRTRGALAAGVGNRVRAFNPLQADGRIAMGANHHAREARGAAQTTRGPSRRRPCRRPATRWRCRPATRRPCRPQSRPRAPTRPAARPRSSRADRRAGSNRSVEGLGV